MNFEKNIENIDVSQIVLLDSVSNDDFYRYFRQLILAGEFECIYKNKPTIFKLKNKLKKLYDVNYKIFFLNKNDYVQLLINVFKEKIIFFCKNTRKNSTTNEKSVKYFDFPSFKLFAPLFFLLFLLVFFTPIIGDFLKALIIIYYSICIGLKSVILCLGSLLRKDFDEIVYFEKIKQTMLKDENIKKLPKYTVLVPMFKENKKTIIQMLSSIQNLSYPKELLDIKLVLEEDDLQTKEILKDTELPEYITNIWTPYFEPRTKPKACNVASLFAEGEILVIFDAEDIPDRTQFMQAIDIFNNQYLYGNEKTDILQGCLCFYNRERNLLTRCFDIEYKVWFRIILQFMSRIGITIPLGGTSNHIKYSFLEKHCFWDSYQVTEDLELSFIANKNNVNIGHIISDTQEWCVVDIKSWFKQRIRWMKGYLLNYLMYCFDPKMNKNIKNFIFTHIIVGYSSFAFLFLPFLFISVSTTKYNFLVFLWMFTNLFYYINYIFIYISLFKNADLILIKKNIITFVIYPFYFLLHIFSVWFAFFEIFNKPFYWSKTKHLDR